MTQQEAIIEARSRGAVQHKRQYIMQCYQDSYGPWYVCKDWNEAVSRCGWGDTVLTVYDPDDTTDNGAVKRLFRG